MMNEIIQYLRFPFVQRALIVGILIALCSSLLGVTLVLKRLSYIGDGLSHVAFGAVAAASVLKLANQTILVLPVTLLCAVLLLKAGQNTKIRGDAAIAMLSVGALAFGYLLLHLFSTSSNLSGDVCSTLFGATAILTLSEADVLICLVLSVITVVLFILLYNRIFAVTFDEAFARASGMNTGRVNLLIAMMIAMIIVLAMNLAGSLLISALVVFPALAAMKNYGSFLQVTVFSVIFSVVCAAAGMLISIAAGTPVGATVVMTEAVMFLLSSAVGSIRGRG